MTQSQRFQSSGAGIQQGFRGAVAKARQNWRPIAIGAGVLALLIVGYCSFVPGGAPGAGDSCRVGHARSANLRRSPNGQAAVVRVVGGGNTVTVLESDGDWAKVRTGRGDEGWVHSSLLDCSGSDEAPRASEASTPRPARKGAPRERSGRGSSRPSRSSSGGVPPAFAP